MPSACISNFGVHVVIRKKITVRTIVGSNTPLTRFRHLLPTINVGSYVDICTIFSCGDKVDIVLQNILPCW